MTDIIERPKARDREAYIQAMWLRFLFAPSKPNPEPDGFFNLGEIGETALQDQRLLRDTPYSICKGIRG